jgi:hypothetical protein
MIMKSLNDVEKLLILAATVHRLQEQFTELTAKYERLDKFATSTHQELMNLVDINIQLTENLNAVRKASPESD